MWRQFSRQRDAGKDQRKGQLVWSIYSHHIICLQAFILILNPSWTILPPEICMSLLFFNFLQIFTLLSSFLQGPLPTTLCKLTSSSRIAFPSSVFLLYMYCHLIHYMCFLFFLIFLLPPESTLQKGRGYFLFCSRLYAFSYNWHMAGMKYIL